MQGFRFWVLDLCILFLGYCIYAFYFLCFVNPFEFVGFFWFFVKPKHKVKKYG
jgi:hypothetical protein